MSKSPDTQRRRLLSRTSALAALAVLDAAGAAQAAVVSKRASTPSPASLASFDATRQIEAGDLDIGYVDTGPANGPVVILLHGWPHDIHSFVDVAPILASEGYRVIVPYLRGYGSTRILSHSALRNGQQAVFAADLIALMDALKIDDAVLAGFDWGGRAASIVAAMWPERCRALHRQVSAPRRHRRHRTQPAAGSARGIRRRGDARADTVSSGKPPHLLLPCFAFQVQTSLMPYRETRMAAGSRPGHAAHEPTRIRRRQSS